MQTNKIDKLPPLFQKLKRIKKVSHLNIILALPLTFGHKLPLYKWHLTYGIFNLLNGKQSKGMVQTQDRPL